jgi:hypothetical protein
MYMDADLHDIEGGEAEPQEVVDLEDLHGAQEAGGSGLQDLLDDPDIGNQGQETCTV